MTLLTRKRRSGPLRGRDLIIGDSATGVAAVAIAALLTLTRRANRAALLLGGAIVALLAANALQSIDPLNGVTRETTIGFSASDAGPVRISGSVEGDATMTAQNLEVVMRSVAFADRWAA